MRVATLTFVACMALAFSACGSGDESPSRSTTAVAASESDSARAEAIVGRRKPVAAVPDIPVPENLLVKDLIVGDGREATVGDKVKIEYLAVNWQDEPYVDSWTYPSPPVFELGGGGNRRLEYGLDLALRGMRVGGRRKVISPARLLYWPDEPHGFVKRINTFVFIIDLLGVRPSRTAK